MKKFIDITFIFTVIVVVATLIAMLFGLALNEQQKVALIAFCFGGFLLASYRMILNDWEKL